MRDTKDSWNNRKPLSSSKALKFDKQSVQVQFLLPE